VSLAVAQVGREAWRILPSCCESLRPLIGAAGDWGLGDDDKGVLSVVVGVELRRPVEDKDKLWVESFPTMVLWGPSEV
jgi:hypothetical protein